MNEPMWESHTRFAERNGINIRTLDRWVKDGLVPPPRRINGRKFYDVSTAPKGNIGKVVPADAINRIPAAST